MLFDNSWFYFLRSLGDPTNRNWIRAEVALDSPYNSFYVGIEGIVGGNDKTDIAIDDTSFSAGCYQGGTPPPPTGLFFSAIVLQ